MARTFTVGPKGDKIRSDLRVAYSTTRQALTIKIRSTVATLYGKSLSEQVKVVSSDLGIDSGKLVIDDFGAVPFIVAARIEAAVKAARPEIKEQSLPSIKPFCSGKTKRNRFRRSRLYLPGDQPKLMLNAGIHKPDAVILDLEDSIAPAEKEASRFVVRNALRSVDFFGAERMVRINQGDLGQEDLAFIVPHNVHVILIPKVETPEQVKEIDERIATICHECGRNDPVYLMPIIESARGVMKALEIAEASPNNIAMAIGLEDYTADIGVQRTEKGRESFLARSMIVNAARAAGIQAIDSVFSDVNDMDGLRAFVEDAKSLGFDGVGCIHPRQIRVIHEILAPSEGEIERAKKIVLAFDEARKKGLGVVSIGSKMIDAPVVKRALRTVDLAIATGKLKKSWKRRES